MKKFDKLASDITAYRTYAKYLPTQARRESIEETINRVMTMQLDRFPKLSRDIVKAFQQVHEFKIMPSMRTMQFAGDAILDNSARGYNCSMTHISHPRAFSEALFLLLSGTGVGYSVQKHHVEQLPVIKQPRDSSTYVVPDTIEGWAQAYQALVDAYMYRTVRPEFDFSLIRPKDSRINSTGAKAPGSEPLKKMLKHVENKFKEAIGRRLRPVEVSDIVCISSEAVLAGGIRRSACICFFDKHDEEMLNSKSGTWWEKHPYRARANISAVMVRQDTTQEEFNYVFDKCIASNAGEPGVYWTNSTEVLSNPCVTGETEILTKTGYKRIDSLVNTLVEVWNGFEWSEVTPKITGKNQDIVKVTFSDGRTLNCTKYHKFHIVKNYKGDTEAIQAKDLKPGMKLIKHEFPIIEHGLELKNAYTQGFVSAEGMELSKTLYIYEPKRVCLGRIQGIKNQKWEENNKRIRITLEETPISKKFVPNNYDLKSKLEWLSGLFDGDGTELEEGGVQLASVDRDFLDNLQKLLSTVGVQSKVLDLRGEGVRSLPNHVDGNSMYYCQRIYRICVGSVQIQKLKALGLRCSRMSFNKSPQRDASRFVSVVDIVENGTADIVYCFNEPKRHLGIFGGVITGQCAEISLRNNGFCNLTTINQTGVTSKKDFLNRVYSASLIGTLQAAYTNFPYLSEAWQTTAEQDALLGVSFTGVADANNTISSDWLQEAAKLVLEVNQKYARKIGINEAKRTTCLKPEGSSSLVFGSSSGIHARHSKYYLRRIRMNKSDALAHYLSNTVPELVEEDKFSPTTVVITIPQQSPDGAITRADETAITLMNRVLFYYENWIRPGHVDGVNTHSVSVTINYKPEEVEELKSRMWNDRYSYAGISLLPYSDHTYVQAPFEECDEAKFNEFSEKMKDVDLKNVVEEQDNTNRSEISSCEGGLCLIS